MFYDEPVFFERNRVRRVYTGGKLFSDFFDDESVDDYYPEEWIASSVRAINKGSIDPYEGISKITGTDIYLNEALKEYKTEMLGEKNEIGILTKLIDSAVRLPVQAHPDKEFSRKYFNSSHGKEESWIILATRPGAKIYYGFRDSVSLSDFEKAIDESEFNPGNMESLLNSIEVIPGDVVYIPAKFVHAIGAGCLLLEVQEPTDFTIQPERWCGEYKLSDEEMYLGLSREQALGCFEIGKKYPAPLNPVLISEGDGCVYQSAIDDFITKSFSVRIITLDGGKFLLDKSAAVYVVTEGQGEITGENYKKNIRRGDYFFIPDACVNKYTMTGNVKITECYSDAEKEEEE